MERNVGLNSSSETFAIPPCKAYRALKILRQVDSSPAIKAVSNLACKLSLFKAPGSLIRSFSWGWSSPIAPGCTTWRFVVSRNSRRNSSGIRRWPPTVLSVRMTPRSHQRFTEDSLTCSAVATCLGVKFSSNMHLSTRNTSETVTSVEKQGLNHSRFKPPGT